MPQTAVEPSFLHVYDVQSGLWASTMLDSSVSLRIQEAMNLILIKDGVLAYIGTKSEFGRHSLKLKNEADKDFRRSWISFPSSTVMSKLGLWQCTGNPEKREIVFHGNPLILVVAWLLDARSNDMYYEAKEILRHSWIHYGCFILETSKKPALAYECDVLVSRSDCQEALSYFDGITLVEDVQLLGD